MSSATTIGQPEQRPSDSQLEDLCLCLLLELQNAIDNGPGSIYAAEIMRRAFERLEAK